MSLEETIEKIRAVNEHRYEQEERKNKLKEDLKKAILFSSGLNKRDSIIYANKILDSWKELNEECQLFTTDLENFIKILNNIKF